MIFAEKLLRTKILAGFSGIMALFFVLYPMFIYTSLYIQTAEGVGIVAGIGAVGGYGSISVEVESMGGGVFVTYGTGGWTVRFAITVFIEEAG